MFDRDLQTRVEKGLQVLTEKLEKNNANPFTNEQYKLLLDAAQKSEERKKDIHSFFITINSIFLPFLIGFYNFDTSKEHVVIIFILLTSIGIMLCLDWILIVQSYKKINYVNYILLRAFEQYLPVPLFSLKDAIINPGYEYERANVITQKEIAIPILFLSIYGIYCSIKVFAF